MKVAVCYPTKGNGKKGNNYKIPWFELTPENAKDQRALQKLRDLDRFEGAGFGNDGNTITWMVIAPRNPYCHC